MKFKIISYPFMFLLLAPFAIKAQDTENHFRLKAAVQYGVAHHLIIQKFDSLILLCQSGMKEQFSLGIDWRFNKVNDTTLFIVPSIYLLVDIIKEDVKRKDVKRIIKEINLDEPLIQMVEELK